MKDEKRMLMLGGCAKAKGGEEITPQFTPKSPSHMVVSATYVCRSRPYASEILIRFKR